MAETRGIDHFSTRDLHQDLGRRAIRGGAVTVVAQGAKFALGLGSLAVLARLLTPEDFGMIGMVTAIIGFAEVFKDLGLSMATVQRHEINHEQISMLFWVNVLVSIVLFFVNMAIAPVITWFYGDPRLAIVTIALGAGFVFGGLTTQHQALLRRQMRFFTLTCGEIISLVAGLSVAIVLSSLGFGYWALVAQTLVTGLLNMAYVWIACHWRPGRPQRVSGVREMIGFGGFLTGADLLHFAMRNVDNVLVGWKWGPAELGFYKRAYGLLLLPIQQFNVPISAVTLPTLSRLQKEPGEFILYYKKALLLTAAVGMPIVAFCFVAAEELVRLLLGDQWTKSVVVFQALAPAAWLGTTNMATGWVYIALGDTKRALNWTMIAVPIHIVGFLVGLPWGGLGVAVAFSCITLCQQPFNIWYCYRSTFLRPSVYYKTVYFPALASLLALGLALSTRTMLTSLVHSKVFMSAMLLVITFLAYSMPWFAFPCKRKEIAQLIVSAYSGFRKRKES